MENTFEYSDIPIKKEGYYNKIVIENSKVKYIHTKLPEKQEGDILNYNEYLEHDIEKIYIPVKDLNNNEENQNQTKNEKKFESSPALDFFNPPCIGNTYSLGFQPVTDGLSLRTFKFDFNITTPLKLNLSVPSFNIYDLPPGINILDYYPVIETGCEFADTSDPGMIFPGIPCAPPELTFCKKRVRIRLFGRTVRLPDIMYPCGIKFKTNYKISLEKSNFKPDVIYSFNGCGIKLNGSLNTTGKFTAQIILGIGATQFLELMRQVDFRTFVSIYQYFGEDGDPNEINMLNYLVKVLKKPIEWFLEIGLKMGTILLYTDYPIISVCITSIKFDYTIKLIDFNTYCQNYNISVNNLEYKNKDIELLTNGKYISLGVYPFGKVNLDFYLGLVTLDYSGDYKGNLMDTIIMMVKNEIVTLLSNSQTSQTKNRLIYLKTFQYVFDTLLSYSKTIPLYWDMLNMIKLKLEMTLRVCADPRLGYKPIFLVCSTQTFTEETLKYLLEFVLYRLIDKYIYENVDRILIPEIPVDQLPNIITAVSGLKKKIDDFNAQINLANKKYKQFIDDAVRLAKEELLRLVEDIPEFSFQSMLCSPVLP